MAVNLDNLGMRVVLTRCLLEELLLVVRDALTARYLRDQVRLDARRRLAGAGRPRGRWRFHWRIRCPARTGEDDR